MRRVLAGACGDSCGQSADTVQRPKRSENMQMLTEFNLGDKVQMRKNHACGANEWEITRCGADIKLRCTHCGRVIMLDRMDFMRSAKRITARAASSDADGAETAGSLPD